MNIIIPVYSLQQAEQIMFEAVMLIGPYMEAIHCNDIELFFDEVSHIPFNDMDHVEPRYYWSISQQKYISYDIICNICEDVIGVLHRDLVSAYCSSIIRNLLHTHTVSHCSRLDNYTVQMTLILRN